MPGGLLLIMSDGGMKFVESRAYCITYPGFIELTTKTIIHIKVPAPANAANPLAHGAHLVSADSFRVSLLSSTVAAVAFLSFSTASAVETTVCSLEIDS